MSKYASVIAVLTMVSVVFCACGSSGKSSAEDKSENIAPQIGVIDANRRTDDFGINESAVPEAPATTNDYTSSDGFMASDDTESMFDQLQAYVDSPEFMENAVLPDMPEHDLDLSGMTLSQQNAVKTALNYIDLMAFSRQGLIEQMSSEYGDNYPRADVEYALSYLEKNNLVDWNEEAAQCAQNYLDIMSFSRDGLYQQMTSESGDKYTKEQTEYALSQVGY